MTIGSPSSTTVSSSTAALIASLQEEATEPLSETKREAASGDAIAERKMEYLSDQQIFTANMTAMRQLPPPGSNFNAKA